MYNRDDILISVHIGCLVYDRDEIAVIVHIGFLVYNRDDIAVNCTHRFFSV